MLRCHPHFVFSYFCPTPSLSHYPAALSPLGFSYKPTTRRSGSGSVHFSLGPDSWLAQVPEPSTPSTATTAPQDGPIELPPSTPSILATTDDPSSLQLATSILLTGAISVFLFRSLRRRARRAKELKFRSSGAKKTLREEALDSLKAMGSASIEAKSPPSPLQALLGGVSAGVIALILYKFTTTIEAALNRQTISDSFSVRQITITIRTIINGLCYLATFVFGINSVGLFLYAGELAIKSLMDDSTNRDKESKPGESSRSQDSKAENPMVNTESYRSNDDESSNKTQ